MRRTPLYIATASIAAAALLGLSGCAAGASFSGTWEGSGDQPPSLEITADGTFSGSDGCNTMVGTGEIAEDTFSFGQFATTRKMCEGVDTWLSTAASATVDGDTLVVFDAEGAEIGALRRA
ncbi:META domain-containing protein [Leucobacter luti]|uniref:META domain-containing protein n=1 Tax=Leucobacter luti TaxID=340320 RepID=UPI001C68D01F|nr:META domain-containing protein [Leucobacter luti]QYM76455.1 META domain-containing protein [Leucobacter luti]